MSILRRRPTLLTLLSVLAAACAPYQQFDNVAVTRTEVEKRLSAERAAGLVIPFDLDEAVTWELEERLNPSGSERRRTEEILDFIFGALDLSYARSPTRSAVETYLSREGNCLSFVNLFVGVARLQRLNPFYVEVEDYQRWNYQQGTVVSRGHIVAGMYVDGELSTFDFLPYQPKAYRDFKPIGDLAAMAHYYNNLGAEALMAEQLDLAREKLEIATALAPDFHRAINNLGIVHLRSGDAGRAIELYDRGLELSPNNVPLMTNLVRAYQQDGRVAEAEALLEQLEQNSQVSPFFYVYRGDRALAQDDFVGALDYMRRAFRIDSQLPEVHVGLVRVYLALGQLDKARHHIERALKLDATHEEARKYASILSPR